MRTGSSLSRYSNSRGDPSDRRGCSFSTKGDRLGRDFADCSGDRGWKWHRPGIAAAWPEWACESPWWAAIARSSSGRGPSSEDGRDSAFVAACDIADRLAVKAAVARVAAALGTIDVLVCNAGTNVRNRSLESLDPADWDRMIATNLTGSFNVLHHVLPLMRKQRNGLVIQICSISGMRASTLGGAATRPRSSARPRWASAWDAKRARAECARR